MKKLLFIIGLLFVSLSYGQNNFKIGKQIEPLILDSGNRIQVNYLIDNCKIEIDGHIVKDKIWFKANLDGIEIVDEKGNKYQKRKCDTEKCDILHLEKNYSGSLILNNGFGTTTINTPYILAH